MAKKIVQVMTGIIVLLVCLVVYFIQVNNDKMIMLCAKLMLSVFVVFLLVSLVSCVAEKSGRGGLIWKLVAISSGFLVAYPSFLAINYIISSSIRRDQLVGLNGNFFEYFSWVALGASVLAVILYNLRKKRGRT